jgi:hypothetical protein
MEGEIFPFLDELSVSVKNPEFDPFENDLLLFYFSLVFSCLRLSLSLNLVSYYLSHWQ